MQGCWLKHYEESENDLMTKFAKGKGLLTAGCVFSIFSPHTMYWITIVHRYLETDLTIGSSIDHFRIPTAGLDSSMEWRLMRANLLK